MNINNYSQFKMIEIPNRIDQFKIQKLLSTGFTATVFHATFQNKSYALKKFLEQKIHFAIQQFELTKNIAHKNIIKYYDYRLNSNISKTTNSIHQECQMLVMQFAQNGELFELISNHGGLNQVIARTYFHQLIEAVQYLHNEGLLHLDIKLQNLLLDKEFHLKLADFGFVAKNEGFLYQLVGTQGYIAPEVYSKKGYDGIKVDLFAIGVVLFIMVVGSPPFYDTKDQDTYFHNLSNQPIKFWKSYKNRQLNQSFKDLIEGLLKKNPKQRMTLQQIKKHKWYTGDTLMGQDLTRIVKKLSKQQYY